MDVWEYAARAADLFKAEMGDSLAGIYVHGSLAMGCFHPKQSDVDLLVIAHDKLTVEACSRLARKVVQFRESWPFERGFELSVLSESCLNPFVYPTPFEFHYSDSHLEKYLADEHYLCGGFADPDLAAHLTIAYYRGIALYGKPLREAYPPIDRRFYILSILSDIENAAAGITDAPVYYTLNLCRVLYFLKEGAIASKKEGGEWGERVLPPEYRRTIRRCLDAYAGIADDAEFDGAALIGFARYMLGEIAASTHGINPSHFQ